MPFPKLREKAMACGHAGAREAWLVHPESRLVEIYTSSGRADSSSFPIRLERLFDAARDSSSS